MKSEQHNLEWTRIVSRAWLDEAFKQRLVADPMTVLREHGVQLPDGVKVKVIEDSADVCHLTLPRKPDMPNELSEECLASVAGGLRVVDDPCAGGQLRAR